MAQIRNFGFMPLFQKSKCTEWIIAEYSKYNFTG